ncbi:hypothetical protein D3C72_2483770 [compost metagenome]
MSITTLGAKKCPVSLHLVPPTTTFPPRALESAINPSIAATRRWFASGPICVELSIPLPTRTAPMTSVKRLRNLS